MYWFLAIVKKEDVEAGNWKPSYILCSSHGKKDTRSPWRVIKDVKTFENMPKVLVTSPLGNDEMVDFLSFYRTRDHMHGSNHRNTKKYYPEGILCWFPCDRHGEQKGPALLVKNVPDKSRRNREGSPDRGLDVYRQMLEREKEGKLSSQVLSASHGFEDLICVKPVLFQYPPRNTRFYKY